MSCLQFMWYISCQCSIWFANDISLHYPKLLLAGLKEERVCIQVEFALRVSLSSLFYLCFKRIWTWVRDTFALMGKGVAVFTHFCPLLNGKHVCQELERKIWVYSEKTNHFWQLYSYSTYRGLQHIWIWKEKNHRMLSYICKMCSHRCQKYCLLILPSLWNAFGLSRVTFLEALNLYSRPLREDVL